jgi:hypothetical protein
MSLRVQFASATGVIYDAGTYAELRLTNDTVYGLPEHRVLARDVNHRWITAQGEFQRLDVEARIKIHFEDNGELTEKFGPYQHFSSADGISYADRKVLAFADHTAKKWYVVPKDGRWAVMVITEG